MMDLGGARDSLLTKIVHFHANFGKNGLIVGWRPCSYSWRSLGKSTTDHDGLLGLCNECYKAVNQFKLLIRKASNLFFKMCHKELILFQNILV